MGVTDNFHSGNLKQGQPLGAINQYFLLTADNTVLDPTGLGLMYIGSDNTTASTRTFTLLVSPLVGHQLTLTFYTGSSTTAELADSGTMKLSSAWTPTQYDVLQLVSDGTNWLEVARGPSSLGVSLASAHILVGNAGGVATDVAMSGDIAIDNAGATSIGTGVIVNADVNASAAIAFSKLATLTDAHILVGSGAGVATDVAMSGDVTIANTGATTIGANAVTTSKLATDVIVVATGTLTQANIVAMNGAPVTLIADPGAGVALIVDEIELFHSYSTAAYTGGDDLEIEYSDGTNIALVDKTIITNTSSTSRIIRPTIYDLDASTGTGLGFAIVAAKGVQVTNATAVFAAGNAANVVKWKVRYHLVTLLT